ncbi:MAG: hypothetical protein ACYCTI_14045 [Acidimicrobiales bacterium]
MLRTFVRRRTRNRIGSRPAGRILSLGAWVACLGLLAGCTSLGAKAGSAHPAGAPGPTGAGRRGPQTGLSDPGPAPVLPTLAPGDFALASVGAAAVATVSRVAPAGPGQGAITVAVFNPRRTQLVLHAGSIEPTPGGTWGYGPKVGPHERRALLAAFNGGFKMADARGGWFSEGRTIVPLVHGAASVVIYADGATDIGTWGVEVPAAGRRVISVRQNLPQLLIDHGWPQYTDPLNEYQLEKWWGVAYNAAPLISRSALGITASGALVWAAGTDVTVSALADALLAHGVRRALELDINAPLVRGFLYPGRATIDTTGSFDGGVLPLVAGQTQPGPGQSPTGANAVPQCTYLTTCSRDFFTVLLDYGSAIQARAAVPN